MIIVNIYVPLIDRNYEFKLNEDVPVYWIIEEISALICQKEQFELQNDSRQFMLYKLECKQTLSLSLSLYENDVKTGDTLILV